MMSAWVNVVLTFPRYFLIAGLTVLAAVFFSDNIRAMGANMDFELVLPYALGRFVPVGLLGFLIAGLLAAFMANFAATVNAAPPYFVNDIYKRYIRPDAPPRTYVRLSYLASFAVVVIGVLIGWNVTSVNAVVRLDRLRPLGRLHRLQRAQVVLVALQRLRLLLGHGHRHLLRARRCLPSVREDSGWCNTCWPPNPSTSMSPSSSRSCSFSRSSAALPARCSPSPKTTRCSRTSTAACGRGDSGARSYRKVLAEDPGFKRNNDFRRDMFNVAVGIVWQVALVVLPMYIVIWELRRAAITLAIVLVTSAILKFTWYDHLERREIRDREIIAKPI